MGGANGMVLLSSNSWMPSPSAAGEFFFLITAGCCEYIMGSDPEAIVLTMSYRNRYNRTIYL